MALMRIRAAVPPLACVARITVALPDPLPADGEKLPVVWLLGDEGRSADHYVRHTHVEALAIRRRMAIVMPEGLHSDYEDMKRGLDWYSYVAEGLPQYLRCNLPISSDPEKNFLLGIGMGGLGALRLGIRKPGSFALVGAVDFDAEPFADDPAHGGEAYCHRMQTIYGDDFRSPTVLAASDPTTLVRSAVQLPRMALFADPRSDKRSRICRLAQTITDRGGDCSLQTLPAVDFPREVLDAFFALLD